MYQLNWNKCQGGVWCNLLNVNLEHAHFDGLVGVYVIWHGGDTPTTVRVGNGVIRGRLRAHRADPEVLRYRNLGLFVTWAAVPAAMKEGVERYLYDGLNPLVGQRSPNVLPVAVNLPW